MLFSIIVPVYRVEQWLDKCMTHLLEQTFQDIEIILVDDESPDACPVMCDQYAHQDPRVKVIHKKNGGLSDARNQGLKAASGDYVMFVDSDDYISRDACSRFAVFAEAGTDILVGDAVVEGGRIDMSHIPADGLIRTGTEYLKAALPEKKQPMAAWLNVYRRQFLLDHDLWFKFGILHEDEQFTPRALLSASTVSVTGISFYHYVLRDNSITTKPDKRKNARDLYGTCCELEQIYRALDDHILRALLLDTLSEKYLSLFQVGQLYRYGKEYIHADFVRRNATTRYTKLKSLLYTLSPKLYYHINALTKRAGTG